MNDTNDNSQLPEPVRKVGIPTIPLHLLRSQDAMGSTSNLIRISSTDTINDSVTSDANDSISDATSETAIIGSSDNRFKERRDAIPLIPIHKLDLVIDAQSADVSNKRPQAIKSEVERFIRQQRLIRELKATDADDNENGVDDDGDATTSRSRSKTPRRGANPLLTSSKAFRTSENVEAVINSIIFDKSLLEEQAEMIEDDNRKNVQDRLAVRKK